MAQGRLERVRVSLAWEVIAARTNKSRAEDRTRRDFPFQVEIVLQPVRELRMVSRLYNVYGLRQQSDLWVEKGRKHIGIYAEKRRQKPINTKQDERKLIAKDADSTPQYGLAVTEDVSCKASLG